MCKILMISIHIFIIKYQCCLLYTSAGHVAWRTGKIEKAAELYSKAALEYGGQEIFREMFGKDKETLVRQGISEKDIPLMMDLV